MDESRSLDIFFQPSKRLIFLSVFFVLICALLLYSIPIPYLYKLLLFSIMSIGTLIELRLKVFLTSPRSIIRWGCDGGLVDDSGNISDISWWYQRRSGGDKIYVTLSSNSRVWADWVSLDFSVWPWQIGQAVLIARDSVEDPKDFQRLKRLLRSH
jgi:hypothetical protein